MKFLNFLKNIFKSVKNIGENIKFNKIIKN